MKQESNHTRLEAKYEQLEQARMEAARSRQLMIEEEESARMKLEDTSAKLLRIQQKSKDAVNKNKYLRELKEKATTLQEEDVMVSRALARSKPLVTEIMEYFSVKESENNNREERIETLVEALQMAIEECLISE
jgi:hypothetical protein